MSRTSIRFLLPAFFSLLFLSPTLRAQTLLGSGISQSYAAGCTPTVFNDFVDKISWSNRRVEPRDCAKLTIATPVFSWPVPDDAPSGTMMTLEIRRTSDGSTSSFTTTTPRLLHTKGLSAGDYTWLVRYTNKYGQAIVSQRRRFTLIATSSFKVPSGAGFTNAVLAKPHPRALPSGSTFANIATLAINSDYRVGYNAFLRKAAYYDTSAPQAVPANLTRSSFSSDSAYSAWLSSVGAAAKAEAEAVETLAYAALLTSNASYETAAISRLVNLAKWSPNGATSEATQDQANRQIYLTLATGLDLFYAKLSAANRQTIVTALSARLAQVTPKFVDFDKVPYNSHLLTATFYVTEALMHVVGFPEFPNSSALLASTWETMITMSSLWGGTADGGFGNSAGYAWHSTIVPLSRFMAAVKLMTNLDLSELPQMGSAGQNQIALTAPASFLPEPFGDGVESDRDYFDYSWQEYRLYANVAHKPEYEWYWRAYSKNVTLDSSLPVSHFLMLGAQAQPQAPALTPALSNSFLFEDAGIVALHSQTTDPLRSSVFFRSSRFGSYNHSHADNNAFTFVSKGKALLISGGYYPYYGSPHHLLVGRATRFKNALTFDGGIGQAEPSATPTAPGAPVYSMDARGQLINFTDNGTWAVTTGDATLAYRGYNSSASTWTPLLNSAVRSVAYNRKEGVVLIYDWATSTLERKWELNFQSLNAAAPSGNGIKVVNGTSSACIDVYGTAGAFTFTSGFPIAPEVTRPNQYQSRFTLSKASPYMRTLTIIREDCRPVSISVTAAVGDVLSASIAGRPAITFARKTVTVPPAY